MDCQHMEAPFNAHLLAKFNKKVPGEQVKISSHQILKNYPMYILCNSVRLCLCMSYRNSSACSSLT